MNELSRMDLISCICFRIFCGLKYMGYSHIRFASSYQSQKDRICKYCVCFPFIISFFNLKYYLNSLNFTFCHTSEMIISFSLLTDPPAQDSLVPLALFSEKFIILHSIVLEAFLILLYKIFSHLAQLLQSDKFTLLKLSLNFFLIGTDYHSYKKIPFPRSSKIILNIC